MAFKNLLLCKPFLIQLKNICSYLESENPPPTHSSSSPTTLNGLLL